MDQLKPETLRAAGASAGVKFSMIIDDGWHSVVSLYNTLVALWDRLEPGAVRRVPSARARERAPTPHTVAGGRYKIELRKAVRRIKDKSPHLTAKEVHLELVDDGFGKDSGGVTIGEVKRACSKVTKERRLSDASRA